jgi:hypothetical protein
MVPDMPDNRASSLTESTIDRPLRLFERLLVDVYSPLFSASVIPENPIGTTSGAFPRIPVLQSQRSVPVGHVLRDLGAFRPVPQLRLYTFLRPHHQFLVIFHVP